jgi:hypothetical protein
MICRWTPERSAISIALAFCKCVQVLKAIGNRGMDDDAVKFREIDRGRQARPMVPRRPEIHDLEGEFAEPLPGRDVFIDGCHTMRGRSSKRKESGPRPRYAAREAVWRQRSFARRRSLPAIGWHLAAITVTRLLIVSEPPALSARCLSGNAAGTALIDAPVTAAVDQQQLEQR